MKKIYSILLILIIGGLTIMSGCSKSLRNVAEDELRNKYEEEFIITEIINEGDVFSCTASPASNPNLKFKVRMQNDGYCLEDDYFQAYFGDKVIDTLEPYINSFYQDSYIQLLDVDGQWKSSKDFRTMDMEDIINESHCKGVILYVFINGKIGTKQEYEKEYEFYTDKIDEMINQGNMVPIGIYFYYLKDDNLIDIKNYYRSHIQSSQELAEMLRNSNSFAANFGIDGVRVTKDNYIEERKELEK